MSTDLGPKVLVVERRCRGAHDVIPTARKIFEGLLRLYGDGYDVKGVTIKGIAVTSDTPIIPKCNLRLVDGELVEKAQPGRDRRILTRPGRPNDNVV